MKNDVNLILHDFLQHDKVFLHYLLRKKIKIKSNLIVKQDYASKLML